MADGQSDALQHEVWLLAEHGAVTGLWTDGDHPTLPRSARSR